LKGLSRRERILLDEFWIFNLNFNLHNIGKHKVDISW
jgi:hypothetical protein